MDNADTDLHPQMAPPVNAFSVSAAYLNSLLGTAVCLGIARQKLLDRIHLTEADLNQKDSRIAFTYFIDLVRLIMSEGGHDDIGLIMAEQSRPGTFSALGYAAMSCASLGEAASLISHYEGVVLDVGTTSLKIEGELASLSWRAKTPAAALRPLHDMILAGWFYFAQWVTGISGFHPLRVCFAHARPHDITRYENIFHCELQFDAEANEVLFESKVLQFPIIQADHEFNRLMKSKADELLAQLATSGSVRQRIVSILRSVLPKHGATITAVAGEMRISERTLRRRLAEEHCSFQQPLTEVRVRLANLYLRDPTLSILDIALLLGYADQSSFTAAFKSWHGIAPGAWRDETKG